jgi:predicted nucleic acid-binding protein
VTAAVCDSNVYISAIVFGGIPRDVVMLGEHKQIQLLLSPGLVAERFLEKKPWADFPRFPSLPKSGY